MLLLPAFLIFTRVVVARNLPVYVAGEPYIANGRRLPPRPSVRRFSAGVVFHPAILGFQHAPDLTDLGPVAFARRNASDWNAHLPRSRPQSTRKAYPGLHASDIRRAAEGDIKPHG